MSTTEETVTIRQDASGRKYPKPEDLSSLRASLARQVGAYIDAEKLSAEEANELFTLHRKVTRRGPQDVPGFERFGYASLDEKERKRWRALVGKAAGEPGLLDRREEDVKYRKQFAELVRRTRPQERLLLEEPGSVRLPADLFEWLQADEPVLELADLAALAFVLIQLENGRGAVRLGRVEGEGNARVLVLPRGAGIGKLDQDGRVTSVLPKCFQHLAQCELLTYTGNPNTEQRIGYGKRLLEAYERSES